VTAHETHVSSDKCTHLWHCSDVPVAVGGVTPGHADLVNDLIKQQVHLVHVVAEASM